MIRTPRALTPWAPGLERLPADLALGLYPWIARLESALGPLAQVAGEAVGEPDGYAGLTRRGPYQRLLSSEWLLLFEVPEEFIRRAASAEQAFFELATPRRGSARRALLLFDAGPSQLGAARLVHLAALIAFARRAHAACAELHWGVLQAPDAGFSTDVTQLSLLGLLRARCDEPVSSEHARAWSEQIGRLERHDDAWLVGGPELRALPALGRWPRLVLEEPLDPELRCVNARLEHPARTPRELELALPAQRTCVQLLRDPYAAAEPTLQRAELAVDLFRSPRFSGDGRCVFAWLEDGTAVSVLVPNSPRARPGPYRVFKPPRNEQLLACGSFGRRALLLTQDRERGLWVSGAADVPRWICVSAGLPNELPIIDAATWRSSTLFESAGRIEALNDHGFSLTLNPDASVAAWRDDVLALAPLPDGRTLRVNAGFVSGSGLGQRHVCVEVEGGEPQREFIALERGVVEASDYRCHVGCVARGELWILLQGPRGRLLACPVAQPSKQLRFELPADTTLCGLVGMRGEPCLLLLERDRRRLVLLGRSQSHTLPAARSEIMQVCVSAARPQFALLSRTGELSVHDPELAAPLARLQLRVPE